MSHLSFWLWVGLAVTLAGCSGSGTTSPSPEAFDGANRSSQANIKYLSTGIAESAGQATLAENPPSIVEPVLKPTPAQTQQPPPEIDKQLQEATARARLEGSQQSAWLQNRLDRRLRPVQEQVRAAEQKYEDIQAAFDRGEPTLTRTEQHKVKRLEQQANRIRTKLRKMSSRYTDILLKTDPIARGLRNELEVIEVKKTETRLAGIEKTIQQAHEALVAFRRLAREIERDNRRIMGIFGSFVTEVEQRPVSSYPLNTDPDLEKAQKQLISSWEQVHHLRARANNDKSRITYEALATAAATN